MLDLPPSPTQPSPTQPSPTQPSPTQPSPVEPGSAWRELGARGELDLTFAAPDGRGSGSPPAVDPARLDALLTDLAARLPLGEVLSVCVQVATVAPLLSALGGPGSRAHRVLAELLRGETVVALAVTDGAGSGSALLDAGTELRESGGATRLDGAKDWITNAGHAEHALVLARTRPARHFSSFRWVLLPLDRPGVRVQPAGGSAFPGAGLAHLRFDGVPVRPADLVGRPGRALLEFAAQVGTERLAGALWARWLCRDALRRTRRHLAERPSGSGVLWDNAAVRERFARCVVEWRRLDALCADARGDAESGGPAPTRPSPRPWPSPQYSALLKAACADGADRILAGCVDLWGAAAFEDGGMSALREQVTMFGVAGGATGTMLAVVAEHADELLAEHR